MKTMWYTFAWIMTVLVAAGTTLGVKYMNVTLKSPPPHVRVDTVHSVVYDTVTVVSRAKDTVRVMEYKVGPLTEKRLVQLICGNFAKNGDYFSFNAYHMVFCP